VIDDLFAYSDEEREKMQEERICSVNAGSSFCDEYVRDLFLDESTSADVVILF